MATVRRGSKKKRTINASAAIDEHSTAEKVVPRSKGDVREQYQSINSLLVEFARDRVKQWKEDLAAESFSMKRRRRRSLMEQEEQEDVERESAE